MRFGALLTDFMRIRPGSMHRSMGGVLVVRAQDLLTDPLIWERLKRVLRENGWRSKIRSVRSGCIRRRCGLHRFRWRCAW